MCLVLQVDYRCFRFSLVLQVIMPETCSLCGKRIRFGRMAVKCRTCRAVAHPECKMRFSSDCSTIPPLGGGATQVMKGALVMIGGTEPVLYPVKSPLQNSLEDFSPGAPPWVPHLMVECVAEIERRGLQEVRGGVCMLNATC